MISAICALITTNINRETTEKILEKEGYTPMTTLHKYKITVHREGDYIDHHCYGVAHSPKEMKEHTELLFKYSGLLDVKVIEVSSTRENEFLRGMSLNEFYELQERNLYNAKFHIH